MTSENVDDIGLMYINFCVFEERRCFLTDTVKCNINYTSFDRSSQISPFSAQPAIRL